MNKSIMEKDEKKEDNSEGGVEEDNGVEEDEVEEDDKVGEG